jgi:hypothetical protein
MSRLSTRCCFGLALCGAASACVPPAAMQERNIVTLGPTSQASAPAAWQAVRLEGVTGGALQGLPGEVQPVDALGTALAARLGAGGTRPVALRVENVRSTIVEETALGSPAGMKIGLAADFVLQGPAGEKRLRLEHSLNAFDRVDRTNGSAYAILVDDLCDRLFNHPEAVAFLGAQPPEVPVDASLARLPRPEVGPVQALAASAPGVEASGRILWGSAESSMNGFGDLMLGKTKGVLAGASLRAGKTGLGGGMRTDVAAGAVSVNMGSSSAPTGSSSSSSMTMMMLHALLGPEVGLYKTKHSAAGYVERPGLTLQLVPQAAFDMMVGSMTMPVPSGSGLNLTVTNKSVTVMTLMMGVGAAAEVDVPVSSLLGFTASYYAGMSFGTMTTSAATPSVSIPKSFVSYPSFDLYMQTATGRMSLGLAFQALAGAASAATGKSKNSALDNPMIVFTYQEAMGRGVAYKKVDVTALGMGLQNDTKVLSSPRSAFEGANSQAAMLAAAGSPHTFGAPAGTSPATAAAAATPVAAKLSPAKRWALLPAHVDKKLGNNTIELARSLLEEAIRGSGQEVVPADKVNAAAEALGINDWQTGAIKELAAALDADHVLQARLELLPSGEVKVALVRFEVPDAIKEAHATGARAAMLRLLKEQAAALVGGKP